MDVSWYVSRYHIHSIGSAVTLPRPSHTVVLFARIIASFDDFGKSIKQSFSDHALASIDCAVIVSNHNEDATYEFQSQTDIFLCVPIRGYVATAIRVHGKAWEVSIPLRDAHQKPLTWTMITVGIRSWPQCNHDRDDVFDPHSDIDMLAQWGTWGYFEAGGKA
jgi:hypothetical protein